MVIVQDHFRNILAGIVSGRRCICISLRVIPLSFEYINYTITPIHTVVEYGSRQTRVTVAVRIIALVSAGIVDGWSGCSIINRGAGFIITAERRLSVCHIVHIH